MKRLITIALVAITILVANAQEQTAPKKVYNEQINPLEQIDQALLQAQAEGKFVICQVGGNWCPWCLRFADFITNDSTINAVIQQNFVYIHANYHPNKAGDLVSPCWLSSTNRDRSSTFRTPDCSRRVRAITRRRCCAFSRTGHPLR